MTLEKFMEFVAEQARGLFSIQECLHPMVHAIDDKNESFVISVPAMGGTDAEKDDAANKLRLFFAASQIKRFALVIEAWMLDLKEVPKDGHIPRPSSSPNRVEIVSITCADHTGEMMGRIPIIRPKKGKPYLGKLDTYRPKEAEGRFVGLLPTGGQRQ